MKSWFRWSAVMIAGFVALEGAPAGASLTHNALVPNALTHNALATEGSALGELNGVAVEGVTLPAREGRGAATEAPSPASVVGWTWNDGGLADPF